MDLRRLSYFVAVGEELNLRRAASRLGLSQPALSLQLGALEQELGLDLVVRDRQRIVALTEAGRKYLREAQRLLNEADAVAFVARAIAAGKQGVLRLGLCEEVCSPYSLRIIRGCRERLPDMLIHFTELDPDGIVESLRTGDVDAAFVVTPLSAAGIAVELLWQEGWLAAVPEQHPLAARPRLVCRDLEGQELLMRAEGLAGPEPVRTALLREHVSPHIVLQLARRSTLLTAAMAQMGIAFLPASLQDLSMPGLQLIPLDCAPMQVGMAYVRRSASVDAFIGLVRAEHRPPGFPHG